MTSTRKPSSTKTPRSSGPAGPSYPAPIQDTALNAAQRERALEEMSSAEGLVAVLTQGGDLVVERGSQGVLQRTGPQDDPDGEGQEHGDERYQVIAEVDHG